MATFSLQANNAAQVTKSDTVPIPNPANAAEVVPGGCTLYIGVTGTLRVLMVGGTIVNFQVVTAGQFLPIKVLQVFATGTSADGIIALW